MKAIQDCMRSDGSKPIEYYLSTCMYAYETAWRFISSTESVDSKREATVRLMADCCSMRKALDEAASAKNWPLPKVIRHMAIRSFLSTGIIVSVMLACVSTNNGKWLTDIIRKGIDIDIEDVRTISCDGRLITANVNTAMSRKLMIQNYLHSMMLPSRGRLSATGNQGRDI